MRYRVYTPRQFDSLPQLKKLSAEHRFAMQVVAAVLPFKVNNFVIEELIDWDAIPDDPIFQMVFPQREMLAANHFATMADLLRSGADPAMLREAAHAIRLELNPHPASQQTLNVPHLDGRPMSGLQHKYRETVLFFPPRGQTCHAYCAFCFRWSQFVRETELHFGVPETADLQRYLEVHQEVSDLLVTGGDPLVLSAVDLARIFEPLLAAEYDHIRDLRLGSKALTYWPFRFTEDRDADELLRLCERLVLAGKHVAFMAHVCHPREVAHPAVQRAVRRLQEAGVTIRGQSPIIAHINDSAETWATLWRDQVRLGIVPYYCFVARNTGARRYFEVPLERCWRIYRGALQQVTGLARTVRGPSMSAGPGKVEVQGVTEIGDEKIFVLRFIQGRNPDWVQRPFFARYDPKATWLDDLQPAFGATEFFYEEEYDAMLRRVAPRH
jgi:KamA family protein